MPVVRHLLIAIVVAWGLLALLVRAATPLIDDWRPQIEAVLSQRVGAAVAIGSMKARWYGVRPLVELREVRVGAAAQPLVIKRASLELSPGGLWQLLTGRRNEALVAGLRMTIDGLAMTVVREADDRMHLAGIGPIGTNDDTPFSTLIPQRLTLVNTELVWIDRKRNAPPVSIPNVSIGLERDGPQVAIRGSVRTDAGHASASARLTGSLAGTEWSGESHLRVSNLDVARLFAPYLPEHYGLTRLSMSMETWTRWSEAVPVHSQGDFALRDLRLEPSADDMTPLAIDGASGDFSLTREAGGPFKLGLHRLRLAMADRVWPTTDLALSLWRGPEGIALDLFAGQLPLADAVRIARVRMPQARIAEGLDALRPRGQLRNLRLRIDTRQDEPIWQARADLDRLGIDAWQGIPYATGISGSLAAQQGLAQVSLNSSDARVDFAGLFRDPLPIEQLDGLLELRFDESDWVVRGDRLALRTPHLTTTTRLLLKPDHDGRLVLDLQTDFSDGDASGASLYYPVGVMGAPLARWLDDSILGGRVEHGSALFHGPLADFAFEKTRSGSFQVVFDVSDVDIDYKPGWPALADVAGRVRFHGNQLDILGRQARIYDSRVEWLEAHIGSLDPIAPIEVRGRLTGPLGNNLRALSEGALRERFGTLAAGLEGEGETTLDLDFAIPLGRRGSYRLDGTIGFSGNRLRLPEWDLALNDIVGRLGFTLDGLTAQGIRAMALGEPVTVDVETLQTGTTRVSASTQLPIDAIRAQLPTLPLGFADGSSAFDIQVDIPSRAATRDAPAWLRVHSRLQGIAIDLPAPLGKPSEGRRPFTVRVPLDSDEAPGELVYDAALAARFSGDGRSIAVNLGDTLPALPDGAGVVLRGHIDDLNVAAWHAVLVDLPVAGDLALPPVSVALDVHRLQLPPQTFDDVSLALRHEDSVWTLDLDAAALAGRARIPGAGPTQTVEIDLERLALQIPVRGMQEASPPPDVDMAVDPTTLPGLTLSIASLTVNDAALGTLMLEAERVPQGLMLRDLSLQGGAATAKAQGHWLADSRGIHCAVTAELSTDALGDLLVGLGYTRQLEEGPGRFDLALDWPGDPTQIHSSTVNGRVSIAVEDGRLVELDPGVTRVVGLLNLNALTRRLQLDFSDLFKKGYSFYSVDGDFRFAAGTASTDNTIVLGPSGRIDIAGTTDLREGTLDQRVRVTPDLDATLPIASTIAGGPLAGIAVLVAQQVLSEQVDEINRFEYRLSGPWANPAIEQLDSGGALSRLLKPLSGQAADAGARAQDNAPRVDVEPAQPTQAQPAASEPGETPERKGLGTQLRGLLDALKEPPVGGGQPDESLLDRD